LKIAACKGNTTRCGDALFIKITLVVGNAGASEFVRQELRAIVGARTQQQQQQQQQQRVPNNLQNNLSGQVSQDDLEALGLTFEMPSAGMCTELQNLCCFPKATSKSHRDDYSEND